MQVRCDEGGANHIGPEPCAGIREDCRRSVGRGTHRPALEPRKSYLFPGADAVLTAEGHMAGCANASVHQPGEVVASGRCACSVCGNREISGLTSRVIGPVRIGKARSRSR